MNNAQVAHELVAKGVVESPHDGEAILDALASIIWEALEQHDVIEWSRVGQIGVASAPRRRRTVTFYPATELEAAVNGHRVEA